MDDKDIRLRLFRKLLIKRVTGNSKKTVDRVKGWFPSDEEGHVEDVIEQLIRDPHIPLQRYGGGSRDNVQLTGIPEAVRYYDKIGGEIPLGYEEFERYLEH